MSIGNGRAARQPLQITLERVTHFLGGILVGLLYVASLPYEILYVGRATVYVYIYGNGTRTSGAKLRDAGRQCKHFFFVVLRRVSFSGHSGAVGMGALYQRTSAEPKILRRKDQGKAHLQNNKQERCVDRVVRLRAMVIAVCLVEFADEACGHMVQLVFLSYLGKSYLPNSHQKEQHTYNVSFYNVHFPYSFNWKCRLIRRIFFVFAVFV